MSCKHEGHLINQGEWWCNRQFKDEKPNPIHLACDCKNCPDYEEYPETEYITLTSVNSDNSDITTIKWKKVSEI